MKFMKPVFAFVLALSIAHSALANRAKPPEPGRVPEVASVNDLVKSLRAAGITGVTTGYLSRLAEKNPEVRDLIDAVSKRLLKSKEAENIKAKSAEFKELMEMVEAGARQAWETRMMLGEKLTGEALETVKALESLIGVVGELATAGPRADMQKAKDVAAMLVDGKVINNELFMQIAEGGPAAKAALGRLQVWKLALEARLGVKLEEFIRRCRGVK